jgi:hypothetical protein
MKNIISLTPAVGEEVFYEDGNYTITAINGPIYTISSGTIRLHLRKHELSYPHLGIKQDIMRSKCKSQGDKTCNCTIYCTVSGEQIDSIFA